MTNEQIRAIAEEIISHLKSSEYLCVCGTCKKNSNKRIQEIAAIISRHLSASVPEQPCAQCGCTHASAYELTEFCSLIAQEN